VSDDASVPDDPAREETDAVRALLCRTPGEATAELDVRLCAPIETRMQLRSARERRARSAGTQRVPFGLRSRSLRSSVGSKNHTSTIDNHQPRNRRIP